MCAKESVFKVALTIIFIGIVYCVNGQGVAKYREGLYDGTYIHGVDNTGKSAQSGDPSYRELPPGVSQGVYSWWNYVSSIGEPSNSYGVAVGFGNGTAGTAEIWAGWTNGRLFTRFLRDCCQGWSNWNEIWTANTDGANSGLDADTVDGLQAVLVQNSGNVGIGTNNPDPNAKLDVVGTIRATEIKVQAQTADFVFKEDYQLKSLEEVEQFIQINKHLPDIPSAKEMKEDGVGLAEMNKLLLQKIEELTLYLIQKDNDVSELRKEIEIIKTQITK